jgi:hypothetical protein
MLAPLGNRLFSEQLALIEDAARLVPDPARDDFFKAVADRLRPIILPEPAKRQIVRVRRIYAGQDEREQQGWAVIRSMLAAGHTADIGGLKVRAVETPETAERLPQHSVYGS